MRSAALTIIISTITTIAVAALFAAGITPVSSSSAFAEQFSFDPANGGTLRQADYSLPGVLIAIASLVGGVLIVLERKKARGIWFSNNERLK